jgi:hypothetical protein
MLAGVLAYAGYVHPVTKSYPVDIMLPTDDCPNDKLDLAKSPIR